LLQRACTVGREVF
jgi:hypothetical protein